MKVLLVLSLLVIATFSKTTAEMVACDANIDKSNCDSEC